VVDYGLEDGQGNSSCQKGSPFFENRLFQEIFHHPALGSLHTISDHPAGLFHKGESEFRLIMQNRFPVYLLENVAPVSWGGSTLQGLADGVNDGTRIKNGSLDRGIKHCDKFQAHVSGITLLHPAHPAQNLVKGRKNSHNSFSKQFIAVLVIVVRQSLELPHKFHLPQVQSLEMPGQLQKLKLLDLVLSHLEIIENHMVKPAALLLNLGGLARAFIGHGINFVKIDGVDIALNGPPGVADIVGLSCTLLVVLFCNCYGIIHVPPFDEKSYAKISNGCGVKGTCFVETKVGYITLFCK